MADTPGREPGLMSVEEKDAKLAARVREADAVILVQLHEDGGVGAVASFKSLHVDDGGVPLKVDIAFGEKDDPPLTIRQITVKAGWNRTDWKKIDRSGLHTEENQHGD
jgi:hypothetical protein